MKHGKKIIFAVFLLALFTPILVKSLRLINEKPLGGVFEPVEEPILTDSTWFSGDFQKQKELYLNENLGYRKTLIRINNQIDFSFFNKNSAEKIVIGKENYLFENNYISATTGEDYIGDKEVNNKVQQAKEAQDILANNGIKLLYVFAPGKGTFFKDKIPDKYFTKGQNTTTNYSQFKIACEKNDINYIDFNSWFLNMKDTASYPLFPKAGIHWSYYGMYLCADSLIKKMETDLNKDLPEVSLASIEVSTEQRYTEYDLGDMMNLLFPIETYDLAYPAYAYEQEGKHRPNTLVVGDSFYWNMYYSGIPGNVFNGLEFWYYNSKYFNDGTSKAKCQVASLDYLEEIFKYEYIIVLQTDGGLNNFGFGFFNQLVTYSNEGSIPDGVRNYIKAINGDPKWLESISNKAQERSITLDEMILIDARYMYEQEKSKQ